MKAENMNESFVMLVIASLVMIPFIIIMALNGLGLNIGYGFREWLSILSLFFIVNIPKMID